MQSKGEEKVGGANLVRANAAERGASFLEEAERRCLNGNPF
jgi:hypothetical protein